MKSDTNIIENNQIYTSDLLPWGTKKENENLKEKFGFSKSNDVEKK
jgi:hypothetical protein